MERPQSLDVVLTGADRERVQAGESGGEVWRFRWPAGDLAYLKRGEGRVADAIADEAARLRWLRGRMLVPAVRLFACTPDAAWLLTDAVPGLTGDEVLARVPDAVTTVVRGCAAAMRRWHQLPTDDCPFDAGHGVRLCEARRLVGAGLVDEADFDEDHLGWTAAAMLAEVERLAPTRPARVVTHGDFSLGNILFDDGGNVTGFIDVGRCGVADPYQDIAILWQNLGEFGAEIQALLLQELGMPDLDQQSLAFHRCLDELF